MYWQNTNSHRVPFLVSAYCYITISTSKITHEKMMLQCTGEKCTLRELVQGQYWLTYVHVYFQGRQSLLVGSDKRTLPNWEKPKIPNLLPKMLIIFPIERDSVPVLKRCCDSSDIVTGCMGDILMDQDQTRAAWISNQVLYKLSFWRQYSNQSDHHNTLCNLTVTIYNVNQIF